jgi:hypothetical protein
MARLLRYCQTDRHNISAGSRNHLYHRKTKLHFLVFFKHMSQLQHYNKYWKLCHGKATLLSPYFGLRVSLSKILSTLESACKAPDVLSDFFKKNLIFSTDFHKSHKYRISRKFVQRKPRRYMWKNGQGEVNRRFLGLREPLKNRLILRISLR